MTVDYKRCQSQEGYEKPYFSAAWASEGELIEVPFVGQFKFLFNFVRTILG